MKKILHSLLGLFIAFNLFAQQPIDRCAYESLVHQLMIDDPNFATELQDLDRVIKEVQASPSLNRAVITIPVVVHVIHDIGDGVGSGSNISDSRIQSQIDILNQDYRRTNSDANNTPNQFAGVAADAEIEFCLATIDPNGNATTGITRHQYNVDDINIIEQTIKGATRWNGNRYLNIWTVNMPDQTILGYAFPPTSSTIGNIRDGVVINYRNFGFINNSNKGRTTTHEVGHYLGLKHMWGDNDSNGNPIGCGDDDEVSDTPNSDSPYYGCPIFGSASCGSTDMFMNYMDYTDDNCMNLFTSGQVNLMRGILEGVRSSLITSANTACNVNNPGGCDPHNFEASDYAMGFNSNDDDQCWIIENRNGDSRSWVITQDVTSDWGVSQGDGVAVYLWNSANAADDYLFSPYLIVQEGHEYELQFDYACSRDENALYPERLEVGFSNSQSANDFYVINDDWVFDPVNNAFPLYNRSTLYFEAQSDGEVSLGFHVFSNPDQYAMLIDNVRIRDVSPSTTNTNELDLSNQFSVYPNPTKDIITIDYDLANNTEDVQISIHNLQGILIKKQVILQSNKEKIEFDLSNASNGMYFVTIKTDHSSATQKVLLFK